MMRREGRMRGHTWTRRSVIGTQKCDKLHRATVGNKIYKSRQRGTMEMWSGGRINERSKSEKQEMLHQRGDGCRSFSRRMIYTLCRIHVHRHSTKAGERSIFTFPVAEFRSAMRSTICIHSSACKRVYGCLCLVPPPLNGP